MKHFEVLNAINVNKHTEKKKNLTYLSWAWAWGETKKVYPDATYIIFKFENNLPYVYDEKTGYMVFTSVTIEGQTHEMWLPVMDGTNKAMKSEQYTYTTKYGEKTCESATMFDINKTIMRCLTKNLAMFGLGLYIYSGEDLPESDIKHTNKKETEPKKQTPALIKLAPKAFSEVLNSNAEKIAKYLDKAVMIKAGYELTNIQVAELTAKLAVLKSKK